MVNLHPPLPTALPTSETHLHRNHQANNVPSKQGGHGAGIQRFLDPGGVAHNDCRWNEHARDRSYSSLLLNRKHPSSTAGQPAINQPPPPPPCQKRGLSFSHLKGTIPIRLCWTSQALPGSTPVVLFSFFLVCVGALATKCD